MDRYEIAGNPEGEFEIGSHDKVMRNKLGIQTVREIHQAESRELTRITEESFARFGPDHRFSESDLQNLHQLWLGSIYSWAGRYRSVNISKDGFLFPPPGRIPLLMKEFASDCLHRYTPGRMPKPESLAEDLARVHAELVLIHPFREGNGRLARLLSTLMALQAGCSVLDFSTIRGKKKSAYIVAVHQALKRNYVPMTEIFLDLVSRSATLDS